MLSLHLCLTEKRRKSSHKPLVLSEACKQLLIYRLPQVLRLHLKRFRQVFLLVSDVQNYDGLNFIAPASMLITLTLTRPRRWSGRNHREKIGVHVAFDQVLNIKPYSCTGSGHTVHRGGYTYDLSAVVMHHGKGFGSGHYTAYCYNTEGGEPCSECLRRESRRRAAALTPVLSCRILGPL